jgi:polysaccharide biosynthesis/export protein
MFSATRGNTESSMSIIRSSLCTALVLASMATMVGAQRPASPAAAATSAVNGEVPRDYVIGVEDVLDVRFWKDADLSREVVVRPDGKIALELLNDVQAAGLTPDELRASLMVGAKRYVEDPAVTVIVKQINSRKVYITGMVEKPGGYPLSTGMTVLQLISMSGGLKEFAKAKDIVVTRTEKGVPLVYSFNYRDILKGKNLTQNIVLKPGDSIVVP